MLLLIGIDWSQDHHNVCVLNSQGAILLRFQFPHSLQGFTQLLDHLAPLGVPPDHCLIAIETHHSLLVDFLCTQGFQVFVIAPSIVYSSRGRYTSSGACNDDHAAFILADLLRTDRHRFTPWKPDGPLIIQMRAQLHWVDELTTSITRYSNRLFALLLRYYPQVINLFSDLQTQIALHFIHAFPTPQAAQALSYTDFVAFCRQQHYTHPRRLPERFAQLQEPAPDPDPVVVRAYQDQTRFCAHLLLTLVQQKEARLHAIGDLFTAHPDHAIFTSLPGAGRILAPKLLVMFGDQRDRFPTPQAIRCLAGTCPVTQQSGKSRRVSFRHACNHAYRHTAQQFAVASIRQAPWAASYFAAARARGQSKSHAYRWLANRWLGIIWKLWQDRVPYDPAYHLQQLQRHRRPTPARS
jgi:transposase